MNPDHTRIDKIRAACLAHDLVDPIDEATWLRITRQPDTFTTWMVTDDGFALVGHHELSLAVAPVSRGRGHGRALLEKALSPNLAVSAWSHGDHPAAVRLAEHFGFSRARELWLMRRDSQTPLPASQAPPGIELTSYHPDWAGEIVRVNAAAFSWHPEQGQMDLANLHERMSQPWFDPKGLILATSGDRLLGFHWTKQHSPDLGEVYVVAVDPAEQGRGLGKLVTLVGLEHLTKLGVSEVVLYVEADNAAAIATYTALGFAHRETHVQYRRD